MSDNEVFAHMASFFIGGLKTVSSTILCLLFELAKSDEIQSTLYDTIKDLPGVRININQIMNAEYLNKCVLGKFL